MDRPHARSIGVNDFVRWHKDSSLELSPKFQRRRVWQPKARSYLIDTILRGLPIPKLYMRQHLDVESTKTIHEVVDGQQRIASVLDFYGGIFKLAKEHGKFGGNSYGNLPLEIQKRFLKYDFSVDVLIDAADADVLEIFARINSYSVPLNAQEKRNAKFRGAFKQTVYALGWEHLEFWKRHRILTDTAISRMREAELTSELVVGMLDGLQDKKSSLDAFYEDYEDTFPRHRAVEARFREMIDFVHETLGAVLSDTAFRRPALFYSLFLALYERINGNLGVPSARAKTLSAATCRRIREAVQHLSDFLDMDEPPRKYARFVTACQRQTDNIRPRQTRHKALLDAFRA